VERIWSDKRGEEPAKNMKRTLRLLCISAILLPLFAGEDPAPPQSITVSGKAPRNVLSNEGIVILSDAGYDEDFLADIIVHKQTSFDVTVDGLAYLANHGISERVVRFMIANEHKSSGPVETGEAPVAPVVMRARVVRQKVLVPDTRAYRRLSVQPTVNVGVAVEAAQPSQPTVAAAYAMVESHLFRNRWYIVNPSYPSVADPMQPQGQLGQATFHHASYFPIR
jgi:hypothetical protein